MLKKFMFDADGFLIVEPPTVEHPINDVPPLGVETLQRDPNAPPEEVDPLDTKWLTISGLQPNPRNTKGRNKRTARRRKRRIDERDAYDPTRREPNPTLVVG